MHQHCWDPHRLPLLSLMDVIIWRKSAVRPSRIEVRWSRYYVDQGSRYCDWRLRYVDWGSRFSDLGSQWCSIGITFCPQWQSIFSPVSIDCKKDKHIPKMYLLTEWTWPCIPWYWHKRVNLGTGGDTILILLFFCALVQNRTVHISWILITTHAVPIREDRI